VKIAILGTKGVPGHHGVEVVVDSLLPHLVAMGHDITVYGYDSYSKPNDDYLGATVKTVSGSPKKNLEMISHMWHASLDVRNGGFDIVHIHSADPCLLGWIPKARFGVVATSHGQAYVRAKWGRAAKVFSKLAERFFVHIPRTITAVSRPLAEYYERKYKKKVLYIPNGINFRDVPDASLLKKWDISANGFLFCSAGRIERTKGLHTLLDAYRLMKTELPLVIAGGGSGSDEGYYEELKKSKQDNVRFLGFLTGDEFFALYAHARVFVFPSEYEAMSMALLEGLSFGTPTVYSNIPENEAVAEGLGYAFDVADEKSLASQIQYVLDHPTKATAKGRLAFKAVREHHDWKIVAKQYHDLYVSLANKV